MVPLRYTVRSDIGTSKALPEWRRQDRFQYFKLARREPLLRNGWMISFVNVGTVDLSEVPRAWRGPVFYRGERVARGALEPTGRHSEEAHREGR